MLRPKVYRELGLSDQEYQRILKILKREPSSTELAMFSVEWSEHCGYPRSRKWLNLFPQSGKYQTLVGEDAGGIIYDGLAIIFKMESHNHPSQVEPQQGAATGVGGIIRDIFTTGARPIACLDSLRFGELDDSFSRYLFGGVISGISSYGNCIGVPTVGGEIYFHNSYSGNCLVNVMGVGIAAKDKIARARAFGIGNSLIYAGSRTGRDGIGGCSILASSEFEAQEIEKRPTVQVGDPFTEKCLIEATLEALATDAVVGIKDMGAAGLTCSISEMAAAGGVGVVVDLESVPLREVGMEPWEIMMSESQERMLLCVKKGKENKVVKIFKKWGLEAVAIGKVTSDNKVVIKKGKKIEAKIPAQELAKAPIYEMPFRRPSGVGRLRTDKIKEPKDHNKILLKLLAAPNIASKRWVYEQYDHLVQINTAVLPGGDAAVLRIENKSWGLAVTTDCNSRYCRLDPFLGAQIAVAEAARNLVVVGAEPAGVTDCLNFGNPEKPDRFYYFKSCVEGIAAACKFFHLPVVSGNVSFYNESPKGAIYPTPTVGMVGIVKDLQKHCDISFKDEGDLIILLGENKEELGGSEYLKVIHGKEIGPPPAIDLDLEKRIQEVILTTVQIGIIKSAHDLSEGGLAVALAQSCFPKDLGAKINLAEENLRSDALLFGETQSRILISLKPENIFAFTDIAMLYHIPYALIGKVGGKKLVFKQNNKTLIDLPVKKLKDLYFSALPKIMEKS